VIKYFQQYVCIIISERDNVTYKSPTKDMINITVHADPGKYLSLISIAKKPHFDFYRAMLRRARLWDCMSSVCPSGKFRYRRYVGWNSSKIISRTNSIRLMRSLTPTWAIWCNGNTPKIRVEWGGSGAHRRCKISETVQVRSKVTLRTNRKSHTRFRLVPTSMTLDDLERLKRHSCRNKQNLWAHQKKNSRR